MSAGLLSLCGPISLSGTIIRIYSFCIRKKELPSIENKKYIYKIRNLLIYFVMVGDTVQTIWILLDYSPYLSELTIQHACIPVAIIGSFFVMLSIISTSVLNCIYLLVAMHLDCIQLIYNKIHFLLALILIMTVIIVYMPYGAYGETHESFALNICWIDRNQSEIAMWFYYVPLIICGIFDILFFCYLIKYNKIEFRDKTSNKWLLHFLIKSIFPLPTRICRLSYYGESGLVYYCGLAHRLSIASVSWSNFIALEYKNKMGCFHWHHSINSTHISTRTRTTITHISSTSESLLLQNELTIFYENCHMDSCDHL